MFTTYPLLGILSLKTNALKYANKIKSIREEKTGSKGYPFKTFLITNSNATNAINPSKTHLAPLYSRL